MYWIHITWIQPTYTPWPRSNTTRVNL
jgi:hypothetical protein